MGGEYYWNARSKYNAQITPEHQEAWEDMYCDIQLLLVKAFETADKKQPGRYKLVTNDTDDSVEIQDLQMQQTNYMSRRLDKKLRVGWQHRRYGSAHDALDNPYMNDLLAKFKQNLLLRNALTIEGEKDFSNLGECYGPESW